jgi:tRNA 2-thiouridine synthesizing protein A
MTIAPHEPSRSIDVTGEICPMTFVRVKLVLEAMRRGDVLDVLLRGEEALANVPRSSRDAGHAVLSIDSLGGDRHRIRLRRG